jgi:LTXXQ motif family protein
MPGPPSARSQVRGRTPTVGCAPARGGRGAWSHGNWHRSHGGYGWYGALFWPYAYEDIYDDVFWGYASDPFWDYGYGDVYGALFPPAGVLPTAGQYANVRSGATANTANAAMCGNDTRDVADFPIDRIQQLIMPTDAQKAALDALANASVKAAQLIKAACPTTVSYTPTGRLDAMRTRLAAMAAAVDVVRGPLDEFYGMLTDEQKARIATAQANGQTADRGRPSATNCNAATGATAWPGAEVERVVKPTPDEQSALDTLKDAVAQASTDLAASCPATLPLTPPARLAAVSARINAMLKAADSVHAALDTFYSALNDEQKAQFNLIGQSRSARR